MNKIFVFIILAVCVLGMALVMLNDRLARRSEPRSPAPIAEAVAPPPASPEEIEANARALEIAEAARALAGPEPQMAPIAENPPTAETIAPPAQVDGALQNAPEAAPPKVHTPPAEAPATPEARPASPAAVPAGMPQAQESQPAQPETRKHGNKTISRFVIYARDKGATVRIGGDSKMEYSSMTLENPDRIVVDLAGVWKFPPNPGVPKNDLVSAVRVGQSGDKTRVVIDLKLKPRKVTLVPFRSGDGVDVRVDR